MGINPEGKVAVRSSPCKWLMYWKSLSENRDGAFRG